MLHENVIKIGYKLFEMDRHGVLYPLFIDKYTPVPMGVWIHGVYAPTEGFSPRAGWHLGADVPDAPWLKGFDGTARGMYKSQRGKTFKRVWAAVEYNAAHDYTEEVQELPGKCFVDHVPENGYYLFREAGKGVWVVCSDIRVTRIITESERQEIMAAAGYDEVAAFESYNKVLAKRIKNRDKYFDWNWDDMVPVGA